MNQKKQSLNILNIIPLLKEKKDRLTPLKLEQPTKDSGLEVSEMAMGPKFGQMELVMKVS